MVRMSHKQMQSLFFRQTTSGIVNYLAQELELAPGAHYRFSTPFNGPRILALHMAINPRYAGRIMGMTRELSMVVGLDREYSVRIDRGMGGALAIEIPKPQSLWYNVAITGFRQRRGLKAVVGVDNDKRVSSVDFSLPLTPHALIAGTTGSGKTNCQKLLVYDLASQNDPGDVQFILIDTRKRGVNWAPFANIPHLAHPVVTDEHMALRALTWGSAEIDRRAGNGQKTPRVFFFVDEAQALLENDTFIKPISDIAAVGREFGIHTILSTQNPTAKQLGDVSIKRNLSVRLVGKVDDATAGYVATGQQGTGAERLIGSGDMFLVQPGDIRRVATALITDKDTDRLPRAETVRYLDLEEYEDTDHVIDQADNQSKAVGRPQDELDLNLLGRVLGVVGTQANVVAGTLGNKWNVNRNKLERYIEAAEEVLRGLETEGFYICDEMTK